MLFVKVFNVIAGNVIFLLIVDSWKCLELFKQETNTRFYKTFSTESADKNKKTHHTITYFDCVKQIWSFAWYLLIVPHGLNQPGLLLHYRSTIASFVSWFHSWDMMRLRRLGNENRVFKIGFLFDKIVNELWRWHPLLQLFTKTEMICVGRLEDFNCRCRTRKRRRNYLPC